MAVAVVAGCAGLVALPAAPAVATGTVPQYDHVFWVVESGQPASAVFGAAPYLTNLAGTGAQASDYTAVDPSPLADRLAMTGGQTGGAGDCLPAQCPQGGDNLASRIEASGRSWRAYAESMPSECSTSASADYAPERVPFLYYTALAAECATNVVPYSQLASDLASAATTPSFVWISPNLQDDMSSSVAQGDSWLQANLPAIFGSPAWTAQRSLLVVVGDQPGAAAGAAVPAVLMASDGSVRAGYGSPAAYDHYNLLSTVEASWGLPALTSSDSGAAPMSDVFTTQPTPTPAPSPGSTPTATPSPAGPPAGTPSPSASPGPSPSAPPSPGATPQPTSSATPSPSPGAGPVSHAPSPVANGTSTRLSPTIAAATPGSNEFTLTAPVVDVVDLTYVGPTTISSGGVASLPVLEFTATSLAMSSGSPATPAFTLQSPCTTQNTLSLSQLSTVPGSATASFSGGVTLYVSSIDFTYLATPYSLGAATPPASFDPIASGQLTGVAMVAARVQAASTSLPSLQTVAFFQC